MRSVMFWRIKKDFKSLFTRNEDSDHFDPIDGLRSIANLSIMLLHLMTIYSVLINPSNDIEWHNYLHSLVFSLNTILSFGLEIFFMLSSFLLTYKLVNQWNKKFPDVRCYLFGEYPLSVLRRAFRLWPGLFLSSLILILFGECRYPSSGIWFEFYRHINIWMFFQNYVNTDYWYITSTPLWSISVDMQIHLILPLFLYFFYKIKNFISMSQSLFVLLILSIIRGMIVFDPRRMSVSSLVYKYPSLVILSPDHLLDWLKRSYNLRFSVDIPPMNAGKLFMQEMYLPLEARFGSFIVGSILAIKYLESSNQHHWKKSKSLLKYLFFVLICIYTLGLIQSPVIPPTPPDFLFKLLISCSRQLFTLGQSFVLFSALCPRSHPYHSPWIRKLLSLSYWIPISRLSYFVYLIHWRISFQLIFGGFLEYFQSFSISYATFLSLPIILFICQVISSIWFVLADKPIERAIQFYLFNIPRWKNRIF